MISVFNIIVIVGLVFIIFVYIIKYFYNFVLGVISVSSKLPRPWVSTKDKLLAGNYFEELNRPKSPNTIRQEKELKRLKDPRSNKSIHASAYIDYIADVFSDAIPTDGTIRALPYETITQFFEEYVSFCQSTLLMKKDEYCGIDTFSNVWTDYSDTLRLTGCKGLKDFLI